MTIYKGKYKRQMEYYYRIKNTPHYKEKQKEYTQRWAKKHPEQLKEIHRKIWLEIKNDPVKLKAKRDYGRKYYQLKRRRLSVAKIV